MITPFCIWSLGEFTELLSIIRENFQRFPTDRVVEISFGMGPYGTGRSGIGRYGKAPRGMGRSGMS